MIDLILTIIVMMIIAAAVVYSVFIGIDSITGIIEACKEDDN